MTTIEKADAFVIGSGPAGQKAAIQLAKTGRRVVLCEQLKEIGGACVHQGTIPSKALRERAMERGRFNARLAELQIPEIDRSISVADLIGEMSDVVTAHDKYMTDQLVRNNIEIVHGRASFIDEFHIEVLTTTGGKQQFHAKNFIIAAGSKPRHPDNVAIDHENIYDSDSILTLAYLPQSMVVLGGGVIACEYASIFSTLGTKVTLIDRYPQPLGFLDSDLTQRFIRSFERKGGVFLGEVELASCVFDGISQVETTLANGTVVKSDKVLCAQGRVSDLDSLKIENAGLSINDRALLSVDEHMRTMQHHIYAAGDVIGPPSLASSSMEQGRHAACHIAGIEVGTLGDLVPSGIYSIPELACVGLSEQQAREKFDVVVVGRSDFSEIARGHIANAKDGMVKLVVSGDGVVRGIHIVGTNATDIGQMGLLQSATVHTYIENVFNFPTYAESYRVAALSAAAELATSSSVGNGDNQSVA
ncbi:MAG: Si-specific NAD(P)(+) transhydrogenase [Pseudomonadales bacterium]|nr:Si-specific NAD(P)(+) transhydrogenase [Pseudomonadales bacterium]